MNIYKIYQTANGDYDTFDSAVVVAENEQAARSLYPGYCCSPQAGVPHIPLQRAESDWVNDPNLVSVELIGVADASFQEETVILASFNAG